MNTKRRCGAGALLYTGLVVVFLAGCPNDPPPPSGDTVVSNLDLTGLVYAPVAGIAPDAMPIDAVQYSGTIGWKEMDGVTPVLNAFEPFWQYKAVVSLTAKPGYTFDGVAADSFTHAGADRLQNGASSGRVTITFPATGGRGAWDTLAQDLKQKFGVSGVYEAFATLHDVIKLPDFTTIVHTGDYIDLPSLAVPAYNGKGKFSVADKDLGDHGRLLRLIVVGVNSFKGLNNNGDTPHVVFQFQNIPVKRRMEATNTNVNGSAAAGWVHTYYQAGVEKVDGWWDLLWNYEKVPGHWTIPGSEMWRYLVGEYAVRESSVKSSEVMVTDAIVVALKIKYPGGYYRHFDTKTAWRTFYKDTLDRPVSGFYKGLIDADVPEYVVWAPRRYVPQTSTKINGVKVPQLPQSLTYDKLWLPTETEMMGGKNFYSEDYYESAQPAFEPVLEYYTTDARRVKYNGDNTPGAYWLASPYSDLAPKAGFSAPTNFCAVGVYGNASNLRPDLESGVSPAFCVY